MEIILLCGIYAAELFCFHAGLRILFEVRLKKNAKWWMIGGVLLPVGIGVFSVSDVFGRNMLITISVVLVMFIIIEGSVLEKAVRLVLAFQLLECIKGIFTYPCENILAWFNNYDYYIRNTNYLLQMCCTAGTIALLSMTKEKIIYRRKTHIHSAIYFVIGIIIVSMMLCSSVLKYVANYVPNKGYEIFCNMINMAVFISILSLIIFVVYIKNTHERMENLLKTEKLLKEAQVNYYKQSLKKEADTRQYRHDMMNHLVYVQDVLSRYRIEDAQNYLANILGGFKKIQNTYYTTGNEMLDVILNYFAAMLPRDAEIEIRGKCPVMFELEDTEVCTIFSNIFQNAVEEITEHGIENARIMIEVQKGRLYAEYTIRNSLSEKIGEADIGKGGLPKSRKSDGRNHGIGMTNIKNAAERNGGKFEWFQEDGYFGVTVVLPIK